MTTTKAQISTPSKPVSDRSERMAKALRENLLKRKRQQRARDVSVNHKAETKS